MMKKILLGAVAVLAGAAMFILVIMSVRHRASMLLVNGTVYTLDARSTVVQAIALEGDRIVGLGSSDEVRNRYPADTVIDLQGRTVFPGFIDAHAHMNGLGQLLRSVILVGAPSVDDVVNAVRERAARAQQGEWIYGRGWDQNLWPGEQFPTALPLDSAAPENPVILIRIDGHAIWVNTRAMALAGITKETKDPDGGRIIRDAAGNPTGVFVDNARDLVERVVPPFTPADVEQNILAAAAACVKVGLTEVHDMGIDSIAIGVYQRLADQGRLPLRMYCAVGAPGREWNEWARRGPVIGEGRGMLTIRAMKLYADGALGSRGAALVESYSDDPGNRGLTEITDSALESNIRAAVQSGFQPAVHAIGDRANHMVLNAYQQVLAAVPSGDYRPRIEHAQVLLPDDIPRFRQLNVLPSMQPIHATSDMPWAGARLGPDRIKGAYAWQSLLRTGLIIPGGSDFPNDGMNPLWGFYAAITREDREGNPPDGWFPDQRMTRDEAARCFTLWGATAAFEETVKGTIEKGKLADLTVLSKDIMKIPPKEILSTDVEMTIVGGKVVYRKGEEKGMSRNDYGR